MLKKILNTTAIIAVILSCLSFSTFAQEKQGHVMRPKPRGIGNVSVVGRAQLEVEYAFNATDIMDENIYLDLQILQVGKSLCKHFSRFLERGDSLYDSYMQANPSAEGVPNSVYTMGRNGEYWSEYQSTEIFTEGDHIHKLQVAANRDHLKAGGARDINTGQLKSNPHPYEPLEIE